MTYCYACDRFVATPVIEEGQPYCQRCACQFPDDEELSSPPAGYSTETVTGTDDNDTADFAFDLEYIREQIRKAIDYTPVPHDDEVTARIDAIIREDNVPEPGTLPPWVLPEEVDAYAADSVPLADQIAEYGTLAEYVLDALAANLADPWFRQSVIRLGVERLTAGYEDYGDAGYHWGTDRRDDEMFEEVADYVVYGTMGPFYDVRRER